MPLPKSTRILAIAGCVFTAGMLIYSARGWEKQLSWWFGAVLIASWGSSPYLAFFNMARRANENVRKSAVLLIGTVLTFATALYLYIDGFILIDDTTWSGLLFVIVPVFQWVEVLLIALFAYLVERLSNPDQNET
jgi:CDP-diglyceride synthetase